MGPMVGHCVLCGFRVGAGLRVAVQALGAHDGRIVHIGHIAIQRRAKALDAQCVAAGILPQSIFDGIGVRGRVGRFPFVKTVQRRQVRVINEEITRTIHCCIIARLFPHFQRGFDDGGIDGFAARFVERLIFNIVIDGIIELVPGNSFDDLLCRDSRRVSALIVTIDIDAHGHAVLLTALDIAQQVAVHVQTAFAVAGGIARAQDGKTGACATVDAAQFGCHSCPVDCALMVGNVDSVDFRHRFVPF